MSAEADRVALGLAAALALAVSIAIVWTGIVTNPLVVLYRAMQCFIGAWAAVFFLFSVLRRSTVTQYVEDRYEEAMIKAAARVAPAEANQPRESA